MALMEHTPESAWMHCPPCTLKARPLEKEEPAHASFPVSCGKNPFPLPKSKIRLEPKRTRKARTRLRTVWSREPNTLATLPKYQVASTLLLCSFTKWEPGTRLQQSQASKVPELGVKVSSMTSERGQRELLPEAESRGRGRNSWERCFSCIQLRSVSPHPSPSNPNPWQQEAS